MKILIVFGLLVFVSAGFAQSSRSEFSKSYKVGSTLYVWAKSGLNLRAKQDMTGAIIARASFGDKVTVLTDTNPIVPMTNENIKGEWVKVKLKDKEGYLFNGFLSRYAPPETPEIEVTAFLKKNFSVKSETTQPPDKRVYNMYQKIVFDNGVEFLWEAPEGGSGVYTTFPLRVITFLEMFLLARGCYAEFFTAPMKCDYLEGLMSCTDAYDASLRLSKENGKWEMKWGHAD